MSILIEALPHFVEVGGKPAPINTDFRAGIRFELMALDGSLTAERLLTNFYGTAWPEPYDDAVKAAVWFYCCGEVPKEEESDAKKKLKSVKRGYDFEADAEAIYTSFWQAYGIDLMAENLHWWTFRALLLGLPEETPFKQRVYYRVGSTDGMTKKQKKAFEERRKRYALPDRGKSDHKMTLEERDAAMKRYVDELFKEVDEKRAKKS